MRWLVLERSIEFLTSDWGDNSVKIYSKVVIDIETSSVFSEESFDYVGKVALCFGDGDGGDTETTVRYAPYVEDKHHVFLNTVAVYRASTTDNSPFTGYTDIDVENAFFGSGYAISSFPSLYDMYGKFMAGLDIDVLYSQLFEDTVNAPEINELVSAEATLLDDDIETNILPRFQTGARDINSVMCSSFVVGKSLIEEARTKMLSKFSAELKYKMIPIVIQRWDRHLTWNEAVVRTYAELMKLYYSARMDVDGANYGMAAKDKLWPFTVLEYERAALGALQGAMTTTSDVAGEPSQARKAIGGALSGAAAGAMVTPSAPYAGAIVGGALGLAASFF